LIPKQRKEEKRSFNPSSCLADACPVFLMPGHHPLLEIFRAKMTHFTGALPEGENNVVDG